MHNIYDMSDLELLTWMELRFGLTKSIVSSKINADIVTAVESELVSMLNKYKIELNIESSLPKIRIWTTSGKLHFMFFDKKSDKRILLGDWLSNKGEYYEH